jgi:periplasmic divalent cation tolerance protein
MRDRDYPNISAGARDKTAIILMVLEHILVLCACGSEAEAEEIADHLVSNNLAACVNISAPVRSVYRWQGKLESAPEWLLTIKTARSRFEALSSAIQSLHSYELPEIIALPIAAGFAPYLKWISDSVHE